MDSSISIYFRADAYPEIGTGHVMRCLALANAAAAFGIDTFFIGVIQDEVLRRRILDGGHKLILLPEVTDNVGWLSNLVLYESDWVVLDGYTFDLKDQIAVENSGARLLMIDDMNVLDFYRCDIVLNQNFFAPGLSYSCGSTTRLLLGPRYALLREEFSKHKPVRVRDEGRRVLISLGGSDPDGVGLVVISALAKIRQMRLEVLYIAGSSNIHLDRIEAAAEKVRRSGHEIKVCPFTDDMPGAMAWANVGLIAAGSTALEVAYMGLPCLVMVLADNQIKVAQAMHAAGIAESLGWYEQLSPDAIANGVIALFDNVSKRDTMTNRGQKLIDGVGARRVVESMLGLGC
jgi:UDP-2,4-diacetamido-2,4,6-trideoxy-beta-L-altropyranose hydrolase